MECWEGSLGGMIPLYMYLIQHTLATSSLDAKQMTEILGAGFRKDTPIL